VNRDGRINGLLIYHLGESEMNQQLGWHPTFVLSKTVTFKDKKIVKYEIVFVSFKFHRFERFYNFDFFSTFGFMRRKSTMNTENALVSN
jgi:hypothetical protein